MGGSKTVLCVKRMKRELPETWDDTMPLPGDIIEGFTYEDTDKAGESSYIPVKARSDFNSQLGKIASMRKAEAIWVNVRRGENSVKIKAKIVPDRCGMLHQKFTIQAATDDRYVAVLGDLKLEQCSELQEMSRRVVNVGGGEFIKRGMKYDWKMKIATYLPDPRSPIISSILFKPLPEELQSIEAITTRSMAWFSASISSGAPLIFVNIQTEQISTGNLIGKEETSSCRRQTSPMNFHIVQGVRLWFLPGISEVSLDIVLGPEDTRFGMEIKKTEEGFICIFSVALGSAADRGGLGQLHDEATTTGHLLVISRLDGKSLIPSTVCSSGLISCCDPNDLRDALSEAIGRKDGIRVHIMSWPNQTRSASLQGTVSATLRPPSGCAPQLPL